MGISFRAFRILLLGLMCLVYLPCMALSICLHLAIRKFDLVITAAVDGIIIAWFLFSLLRRTVIKTEQTVALEAVGAFTFLPFVVIIALIACSLPTFPQEIGSFKPVFALQILLFINALFHVGYTATLLFASVITATKFDRDVWFRDIDSSPSPFPLTVIFPCFSNSTVDEASPVVSEVQYPAHVCVQPCNCSGKPLMTRHTMRETLRPPQPSQIGTSGEPGSPDRRTSIVSSLVRLPDEVERRSSIPITFETVSLHV